MSAISGYASATSVFQGETIGFHVSNSPDSPVKTFTIRIYRYPDEDNPIFEDNAAADPHDYPPLAYKTGCYWPSAYSLSIPEDWASGLYKAVLTNANGASAVAYFVVKSANPGSTSNVLLMFPFTTYQAYNSVGGKSLYDSLEPGRSRIVSFDRPTDLINHGELNLVSWLENNGYDTESCTSIDIHTDPDFLSQYQLLLSVGHDEYWSKEMRDNVENFIANGGNVAFFSANTCWWQVRFEDDGHTMACYKSAIDDPLTGVDDERVTINWSSAPINRPENSLMGVSYLHGGGGWNENWQTSASYQVCTPDHWVFEGTGLKNNDTFAFGVVGYETDAALFEEVDGVLRVTGKDGTPLNFQVLATSDLGLWRQTGQGGWATMGIYTNVGTVFTAATVDWCTGLNDPIIARITKNVIDRLSQLGEGEEYKLTDIRSPSDEWEKIGIAENIVAMAGHVEGKLFAATSDGDLIWRDAVGEDVKWQRIGNAEDVIALAAPAIGDTDRLGRLFAATTENDLLLRDAVVQDLPWQHHLNDINNVVAMACVYTSPMFIVNGEQEFWAITLSNGQEELIGLAPGIMAMSACDGKLFAASDDGRLLCRETVTVDIEWTIIGQVPENTVALAAYNGKLFVATSDNELWWRAAVCIPAPMYTGSLLFYDAQTGKGAIGPFHGNGDFETRQYYPDPAENHEAFAKDWTHVVDVAGGFVLFYQDKTGKGAVGQVDSDSTFTNLQIFPDPAQGNPAFSKNWTHLAATTDGLILFYDADTGKGATGTINDDGTFTTLQTFPDQARGNTAFSPKWTHVVPASNGIVLFYDEKTGKAATGGINDDGTFVTFQVFPDPARGNPGFAPHWTHIVAARDGLMLFYDADSGRGTTGRFDNDGTFTTLLNYNFSPKWTEIVSGANGLILFYNKASGAGVAGGLTLSGTYLTLQEYRAGSFSSIWTHIAQRQSRPLKSTS